MCIIWCKIKKKRKFHFIDMEKYRSQHNLVLKFPFYLIIFKDSSYFKVLKVTFQTMLQ